MSERDERSALEPPNSRTRIPLHIHQIFGDRPFAEIGDPVLTVDDERRHLLAVAGLYDEVGEFAPVGVYATDDLSCRRADHRI